jgi:hypothetical protein
MWKKLCLAVFLVATSSVSFAQGAFGYINLSVRSGWSLLANPFEQAQELPIANVVETFREVTFYFRRDGVFVTSRYDEETGGFNPPAVAEAHEAFFIFNPGAPLTLTLVGSVAKGPFTITLTKGYHLMASPVPLAGSIPAILEMPLIPGAIVFTMGAGGYSGFMTDEFEAAWSPREPTIGVGEGFWLYVPETVSWTRSAIELP